MAFWQKEHHRCEVMEETGWNGQSVTSVMVLVTLWGQSWIQSPFEVPSILCHSRTSALLRVTAHGSLECSQGVRTATGIPTSPHDKEQPADLFPSSHSHPLRARCPGTRTTCWYHEGLYQQSHLQLVGASTPQCKCVHERRQNPAPN